MLHLKDNTELVVAVVDFLDGVKEGIENNLKLNFAHLENIPIPPVSNNEGNEDRSESTGASNNEEGEYKSAITIVCDSTKLRYSRIMKDLKTQYSVNLLPSYYTLTKN